MDHGDAGFGRAVERLDRLHDRRLRQSPREDRRTKSSLVIEAITSTGTKPYLIVCSPVCLL
jgi:hypothetical protein